MLQILAALLLSGAALPAATDATMEEAAASPGAEWQAAEANRVAMKRAPAFIDGPEATLPESEMALGHHGTVFIQGIIDADGRMHEARVKESSLVPALDAIALAAATDSTFTPATDADGAPLPVVITMPFDLVAYKSRDGGLFKYSCAQFVRDMDWWQSAHPDKSFKDHELYKLESGLDLASLLVQTKDNQALLTERANAFDDRWLAAIAFCRKKPKTLQRDAIFR